MIGSRGEVTIRHKPQPRIRADTNKRKSGDRMFRAVIQVIGQVKAANRDGQSTGVIYLEPVIFAAWWIGHPFIDLEVGNISQRRDGRIRAVASRACENPVGTAIGNAPN